MSRPHFSRERLAISQGLIVCGVDEAGRGPLAGPVVAAAVILDPARLPKGLNDSKQIPEAKREALFSVIQSQAQVGIGIVDAATIDQINILQATFLAMRRAVLALATKPTLALIDGNRPPPLPCAVTTIVGGDAKCSSIAAASIIAKVTRDRFMNDQHLLFPQYGFERHKGYGTEDHIAAIATYGPCPLHRLSFSPFRPKQLDLDFADNSEGD
jgi:ribonuclease HII